MRIGLVTSSGGHLQHLLWLAPWWSSHERFWVGHDTEDARAALRGERVWWAHHPTNRHLGNLARNTALAARVLAAEQPDLLVSTGAGVALPFLGLARALDIPCLFVEVFDRVTVPSLTGRLLAPFVDVVVQWPEQRQAYPHGILLGPIR
ncbi:MAG: UDP-N-acetylglucosamine--LPS N-acetylglucosamine transferase [Alphaproteobacteria bacterium]|nr:UDP-N-acetylglucosamine--LPS N-acetylglucosamine transferase [Alphaproteobacteria bacterium]